MGLCRPNAGPLHPSIPGAFGAAAGPRRRWGLRATRPSARAQLHCGAGTPARLGPTPAPRPRSAGGDSGGPARGYLDHVWHRGAAGAARRPGRTRCDGRADGGDDRPPRPRRRGRVGRPTGPGGARLPAARDLDLSAAGHQPMVSADGRFVIGLQRRDLQLRRRSARARRRRGSRFRGHSDTEVLLARDRALGPRAGAAAAASGCSRFALWDRQERELHLGARPAGREAALLRLAGRARSLFGSELKALRAHPGVRRRDRPGRARAATCASATSRRRTRSIAGIRKLPPGDVLTVRAAGARDSRRRAPTGTSVAVARGRA